MLIVFYVLLVWLKIIVGTTVVFLWLWIARDRGATGFAAALNTIGALLLWVAPWVVFVWTQSDLYRGHCGLRQGVHDCGLAEFLWTEMRWVRLGVLLDIVLLVGVLFVIFRSRVSRDSSEALRAR